MEIFISFDNNLTIVKRRVGGHDGRGQWRLHSGEEATLRQEYYSSCIIKQGIAFGREVSLTNNFHQEGILRARAAFHPDSRLQQQAENMLGTTILHKLEYVGVMAMECFIVGD